MPVRYFLDTSALVARYLRWAAGHVWMRGICDPTSGNTIALVEIVGAEFAAACNQMMRGGLLRRRTCDRALTEFWTHIDGGGYQILPVNSLLVRRAADLCATHSLKGYDAVQLAAALTFRDDTRTADATITSTSGLILGDPIFQTEDNRLATAATAEGFTVDSPLAHP
jgi:predicted nucleic acid-binding protein